MYTFNASNFIMLIFYIKMSTMFQHVKSAEETFTLFLKIAACHFRVAIAFSSFTPSDGHAFFGKKGLLRK